jgi:hypothetical protein
MENSLPSAGEYPRDATGGGRGRGTITRKKTGENVK